MDGEWLQNWVWLDFANYKEVVKQVPTLVVVEGGNIITRHIIGKKLSTRPTCETSKKQTNSNRSSL